jgi:hypothetical protein
MTRQRRPTGIAAGTRGKIIYLSALCVFAVKTDPWTSATIRG